MRATIYRPLSHSPRNARFLEELRKHERERVGNAWSRFLPLVYKYWDGGSTGSRTSQNTRNIYNLSSKNDSSETHQKSHGWAQKYLVFKFVVVGAGMAALSLYQVKKSFHETVPGSSCILDVKKQNWIYPFDPEDNAGFFHRNITVRWPVISYITRPLAWQIFEEMNSDDPNIREDAIRRFANISSLLDSECQHFAFRLDLQTAIALARKGADPRLFVAHAEPRRDGDKKDYYGTKFRLIFSNLPKNQIHDALNEVITAALKTYDPTELEQDDISIEYYSGFESDFHLSQNPIKYISESDFLKICLQGIVSHSRIPNGTRALLSMGILEILVAISEEYKGDAQIMSLVLKVLANLSCDVSSAELMRETGCLKILAEYAKSSNIRLLLPAKRALQNLDRESSMPILPSGIYQLYPEFGSEVGSYSYDIVFVHGLLGGVFRTWRRQDLSPDLRKQDQNESKHDRQMEKSRSEWKSRMFDLRSKLPMQYNPAILSNPDKNVVYPSRKFDKDGNLTISYEEVALDREDVPSGPTDCWPKDWLPQDCPNARIIGVDFETFISRWMNICPIETVQRKLSDRSNELLVKLKDAGVGRRPIIWVTHSMGGLLVKNLLCQAMESSDPELHKLSSNTKGVIFCSVPHRGTQVLVLNTARRWLFLPTEEIEELSNTGCELTNLQSCFEYVYNKLKFQVLSFGEILETRTGLGMKFKLVPFHSADVGVGEFFPVRLDHLSTCKPWSRESFMYRKTVELIKNSVEGLETSQPPPSSTRLNLIQKSLGLKDKILKEFVSTKPFQPNLGQGNTDKDNLSNTTQSNEQKESKRVPLAGDTKSHVDKK